MLEVRLLGQFDIRFGGKPIVIHSRPAQSLLAYLFLNAGISQRREKLAGMLWPDTTEVKARSYLRQALWRTRKALTAYPLTWRDYLRTDDIAVMFSSTTEYWLDVDVVLEKKDPEIWTVEELIQIASVYRGELLPGFYDEWVYLERERLRAAHEHKMKLLMDRLLKDQRWEDVLHWGERWIALGYAAETAYRALMMAHACMGDTSSAIAIFNRCVENLERELGVEPSPRTQEIHEQLVNGEIPEVVPTPSIVPEHVLTDEPPVPGDPPYKGLQHFEEDDAEIFCGRETLTAKLVDHLRQDHRLIVVVGASGSGKSSVVRAGLVPALRRTDMLADGKQPPRGSAEWQVRVITPTARPLESLATSLTRGEETLTATTTLVDDMARDPRRLYLAARQLITDRRAPRMLLVVDQFEELFTLCRDEDERKAFIDNLLTAVADEGDGSTAIVITLRADFYAHCSEYPDLRSAITKHQEYIGPMSAREMRRAIEGPARRGGWDFQPGMVDLFLRDVKGEPGALPLLSHALLETWRRRSGHTLTLKGYAAAGGVPGAIARTADTVFNHQLTKEQQTIARNVFLRLTELGTETQGTRRRVALSELIPRTDEASAVEEVLRKLADARLITIYEDTAEVAHEALIREWPTLREWLDEDREGLKLHRHLTESAQEWEGLDRDPGELYRGARLAQASEWAIENESRLNELEREFLSASQILAAEQEAQREAQRQRELEAARKLAETERKRTAEKESSIRRLRWMAVGLGGILLVAIVAAGVAMFERKRAEDEAHLRASRELSAAAIESLTGSTELALLLALQAVDEARLADLPVPLEAEYALHQAVQAWPLLVNLAIDSRGVYSIDFSPDGTLLAAAGGDGTIRILDAARWEEILILTGHEGLITEVVFSPDGRHLATSGEDRSAKVWDSRTGRELLTFAGHPDEILGIAYSPDGMRLATASGDGTAQVWDSSTGEVLVTFSGHTGSVHGIAFGPSGERVATASGDGTVKVWEASTGEEIISFPEHEGGAHKVEFSPDGLRLVTSDSSNGVFLWDASTGAKLYEVNSDGTDFDFNLSGDLLALASGGFKDLDVIDVATGHRLLLLGHASNTSGVSFNPDGTRLASCSEDGIIRVWDTTLGMEFRNISTPGGSHRVVYSPDSSRLAAGVGDSGRVKVWDSSTGEEVITLHDGGHEERVVSVAFSTDGSRLVSASVDGTAKIWEVTSGRCLHTLTGHNDGIRDVAFSLDGERVATGSLDGSTKVWDVVVGHELMSLEVEPGDFLTGGEVYAVAFSPDGRLLATGNQAGYVKLWDLVTEEEVFRFRDDEEVLDLAFNADGTRLAVARNLTVSVLNMSTRNEVLNKQSFASGHSGPVSNFKGIGFSPDGTLLGLVGSGGKTMVLDSTTGADFVIVSDLGGTYGHDLTSVAFSPDGKFLATSSEEAIRIYLLDIGDLGDLAESRLTRDFTQEECQRYLSPDRCRAALPTYAPLAGIFRPTAPANSSIPDYAEGKVLFEDDFEDGGAKGWNFNTPHWSIQSDQTEATVLHAEALVEEVVTSIPASVSEDVSISFQVRFLRLSEERSSIEVLLQSQKKNGDCASLAFEFGDRFRFRPESPCPGTWNVNSPLMMETNKWYSVHIEVYRTAVKVFIDDEVIMHQPLFNEDMKWDVHMGIGIGASVDFDDVLIRELIPVD